MNKHIFILGTAIEPFMKETYSVYDSKTRYMQTLETIQSIKQKVPNSYICLAETSSLPIDKEYETEFKSQTDLYVNLQNSEGINTFSELCRNHPKSSVYIKSLFETYGLLEILYRIQKESLFTDSQRIFKLTGRYILNDKFNIVNYESEFLDHYIVGKVYDYKTDIESIKKISPECYLYKYKGSIETCLWSFGKYQFGPVVDALTKSFDYLQEMIRYTTGSDIEHALYHYLDRKSIVNVSELGVTVRKGFEGEIVNK